MKTNSNLIIALCITAILVFALIEASYDNSFKLWSFGLMLIINGWVAISYLLKHINRQKD